MPDAGETARQNSSQGLRTLIPRAGAGRGGGVARGRGNLESGLQGSGLKRDSGQAGPGRGGA